MKQIEKVPKINYIFLLIAWIIGSICLPGEKILATSAAVNLSLSTENVMVDSTFSVVLTVEASEEIEEVSSNLLFDNEVLQFVSGGAYVTGGNGVVVIADTNSSKEDTTKKYSMKFKAMQAGETTIWLDEGVRITSALDSTTMSVSSNQLLLEVTDPDRMSEDASLKKLLVSSGTLKPKFSQDIKEYAMEVEYNINQISVNAIPSEENASVSISGNKKLKSGKNTVEIVVTAPSGKKSVTKLVVLKKDSAENTEIKSDEETNNDVAVSSSAVIAYEDEEGNRFLSQELQLQILPLEDEKLLPASYVKTKIVKDGVPVTVYTLEYDTNYDTVLVYGKNQEGEAGFYQYNKKNNTLVKYEAAAISLEEKEASSLKNPEERTASNWSYMVWIVLLGFFCILLSIALVLEKCKVKRGERNQKEDDFF